MRPSPQPTDSPSTRSHSVPTRSHSILTRFCAIFAAVTLAVAGALVPSAPALADTRAYEFAGRWVDEPDVVVSGLDVLGAEWTFDINDDRPAPSNDPVANNVVTVTLDNATFSELPTTCLTSSPDAAGNEVTPLSSLSEDKRILECNIGTRDQGTAELAFTGVLTEGPAGSHVSATGSFRGHTVDLPRIPITNEFAMDAKFDGGGPQSHIGEPTTQQFIEFPFSLSHGRHGVDGPTSVSYDLHVDYTGRATFPQVKVRGAGCVPMTASTPGTRTLHRGTRLSRRPHSPTAPLRRPVKTPSR